MESPWAGDGRGLVTQRYEVIVCEGRIMILTTQCRIFTKEGILVATCVQEVSYLIYLKRSDTVLTILQGVVRLKQQPKPEGSSKL